MMRFTHPCSVLAFPCSILVLALVVWLSACSAGKLSADEKSSQAVIQSESDDSQAQAGARALSRAFRGAARKATPAVVTVLSYGQNSGLQGSEADQAQGNANDEQDPAKQLTALGSGVIVSEDGMVITNNHVISDAKRVVIQLYDETEIEAINVHGDPDSDVATLRIVRDQPFECTEIGDSDALEIGDWVLAIGSPFRLEATVSAGIISAKNRTLPRINRGRLFQTDAAINPGNSGGPLIDLDGHVIAINTAIATRNGGYQGIGFAIPINQAKWIADELDSHGKVRRAAIGIRTAELNPKIAGRFKLPVNLGVLAYQVISDSAADRAGIKLRDVIMEFAGERVRDPGDFQEIVERKPVGSMQQVKIYRAGKEITLEVELAPWKTRRRLCKRRKQTAARNPHRAVKIPPMYRSEPTFTRRFFFS